jgi:hypothetical protein
MGTEQKWEGAGRFDRDDDWFAVSGEPVPSKEAAYSDLDSIYPIEKRDALIRTGNRGRPDGARPRLARGVPDLPWLPAVVAAVIVGTGDAVARQIVPHRGPAWLTLAFASAAGVSGYIAVERRNLGWAVIVLLLFLVSLLQWPTLWCVATPVGVATSMAGLIRRNGSRKGGRG